jgi:hypothetical protein
VLVGEVDGELPYDGSARAVQRPEEATVAVHDDEAPLVPDVNESSQAGSVKLVVAQVHRRQRSLRLKLYHHHALFSIFIRNYVSAVCDQPVRW